MLPSFPLPPPLLSLPHSLQERTLGHLVIDAALWRQPLAQIEPAARRVFVFYPSSNTGPRRRDWLIGEASTARNTAGNTASKTVRNASSNTSMARQARAVATPLKHPE